MSLMYFLVLIPFYALRIIIGIEIDSRVGSLQICCVYSIILVGCMLFGISIFHSGCISFCNSLSTTMFWFLLFCGLPY